MKYLLELDACAEMLLYDSIESAKVEAELIAKEHGEPMNAIIWDTLPAGPEDIEFFEEDGDTDVSKPNWWANCVLPNNIVEDFMTASQN